MSLFSENSFVWQTCLEVTDKRIQLYPLLSYFCNIKDFLSQLVNLYNTYKVKEIIITIGVKHLLLFLLLNASSFPLDTMAQTPLNLDTEAHKLRTLILNARKPFVLRNFIMNWKCFEQSLKEWCTNYDNEVNSLPEFEVMPCNQGNNTPHWERCRESIRMSLSQFLEKQKTPTDEFWIGLNYQRMKNIPNSLKDGIDFSRLGFSEATNECNYWLCSAQTNTPCHYDTYGCNVVVQVYGR